MSIRHVAVIGDHDPNLPSHVTVDAALALFPPGLTASWIATDEFTKSPARVENFEGVWIAPGSPYRSFEGALLAIRHARENDIPLLGT